MCHLKNASLLFKWRWRYADEQKPLWKEIINSNHDHNYSGRPRTTSNTRMGSLWCQITNFENFSKETQEVAKKGIQVKVGNGAQARFWVDFWIREDSLMVMFPRLFGLSTQKKEVVANFGESERGEWTWKFQWRRNLFSWEEDLVGDLVRVVNRWRMRESSMDVRVWAFDNAPSFMVSKFFFSDQSPNGVKKHGRWKIGLDENCSATSATAHVVFAPWKNQYKGKITQAWSTRDW